MTVLLVPVSQADRRPGDPTGYELCHPKRHNNYEHVRAEAMWSVDEGKLCPSDAAIHVDTMSASVSFVYLSVDVAQKLSGACPRQQGDLILNTDFLFFTNETVDCRRPRERRAK
jgi:hypothetical protein